jgi:hypothetical protein
MGYDGSFVCRYQPGEMVPHLHGVSVTLDGANDDFIGDCDACGRFFEFGAEIRDGRVEQLFVLEGSQVGF